MSGRLDPESCRSSWPRAYARGKRCVAPTTRVGVCVGRGVCCVHCRTATLVAAATDPWMPGKLDARDALHRGAMERRMAKRRAARSRGTGSGSEYSGSAKRVT